MSRRNSSIDLRRRWHVDIMPILLLTFLLTLVNIDIFDIFDDIPIFPQRPGVRFRLVSFFWLVFQVASLHQEAAEVPKMRSLLDAAEKRLPLCRKDRLMQKLTKLIKVWNQSVLQNRIVTDSNLVTRNCSFLSFLSFCVALTALRLHDNQAEVELAKIRKTLHDESQVRSSRSCVLCYLLSPGHRSSALSFQLHMHAQSAHHAFFDILQHIFSRPFEVLHPLAVDDKLKHFDCRLKRLRCRFYVSKRCCFWTVLTGVVPADGSDICSTRCQRRRGQRPNR